MKISLNNIRFHANHGVLPQEREIGGDYLVSIRMHLPDDDRALVYDNLCGTIDYAEAYAAVSEEMREASDLLENVAYRIAERLLFEFYDLERVEVSVTKVSPPISGASLDGATVEISLER